MFRTTIFRSVTTTVGAAVLGATVAVAGVVGATEVLTPTAADAPAESSAEGAPADRAPQNRAVADRTDAAATCAELFTKLSEKLPDALVADLRELRDVAPAERREALLELRENARDGKYGERAQQFVESGMLQRMWREVPAELRSDLLDILELPNAQVPDALRAVLDDAVSGVYGARVQFVAERIQEHVEKCDS
jgi:hypothetical protein